MTEEQAKSRTLRPGDHVPHFEVTRLSGGPVAYRAIWQRRLLLLVSIPADDPATAEYLAQAREQMHADHSDTAVVITADEVPGLPRPGVLVADRWGEIAFVAQAETVQDLPDAAELMSWLRYVQMKCPECEGESK